MSSANAGSSSTTRIRSPLPRSDRRRTLFTSAPRRMPPGHRVGERDGQAERDRRAARRGVEADPAAVRPRRCAGTGRGRARCPAPARLAHGRPGRSARRRGRDPRRRCPPRRRRPSRPRSPGRAGEPRISMTRTRPRTSPCSGRGWPGPAGSGWHRRRRGAARGDLQAHGSRARCVGALRRRSAQEAVERDRATAQGEGVGLELADVDDVVHEDLEALDGARDPVEVARAPSPRRVEVEEALGIPVDQGERGPAAARRRPRSWSSRRRGLATPAGRAGRRPPRRRAGHARTLAATGITVPSRWRTSSRRPTIGRPMPRTSSNGQPRSRTEPAVAAGAARRVRRRPSQGRHAAARNSASASRPGQRRRSDEAPPPPR